MLGFLLLFAVGVGAYALVDDGGSAPAEDSDSGDAASLSDEQDAIAGRQWEGLVDEDEIKTARMIDDLDFQDGAIDVNTLGGSDTVLGSEGNDKISTGDGDDYVIGDAGDDEIDLGAGDDIAGFALRADGTISTGSTYSEPGDDRIRGFGGNDQITDSLGSNTIEGNPGNDTLVTLDREADGSFTPDMVFGGFGDDTITVDSGDEVNTGPGKDVVIVDLYNYEGEGAAPEPVTITDLSLENDQLTLRGPTSLLETPPLTDPEDITVTTPVTELINPITLTSLDGETGTSVRLDGVEIVRLLNVTGLNVEDINITT